MYLPEPSDREFELPPAGTHLAVCYRVIDLGTQDATFQGQPKRAHKVLISWELPEELMSDGRPFSISQRYTWSMSEKARLRHDLESWRGRPFTEADFGPNGFNIKNIIGKGCLLTIVHQQRNGKIYADITGIARLMKSMQAPQPTNQPAYLWINVELWDPAVFSGLSQGLKATIMKSPEYHELIRALEQGDQSPEPPPIDAADQEFIDSIPF